MILKKPLTYRFFPRGGQTVIPAGTRCDPARNLPVDEGFKKYWARGWRGMSADDRSHQRNYGFLIAVPNKEKS